MVERDNNVTPIGSFVSQADFDLVRQDIEHRDKDRRRDTRRVEDRVMSLQLDHDRLDQVVRGRDGANGLASEVRALRESEARRSRREWVVYVIVAGSVLSQAWDKLT